MLPNPANNLQVSAGTGMNVIVSPGFAIVNGCLKLEESQRTLALQAADSSYDRIDTVVMRLDDNDDARNCDLYIVEGIPASGPVRPELTRSGSVWEIGLADILVAKNTATVSNQRITDTRYETSRCGVISSISQFDTTTLYQQVQSDLAEFKASEQAEFVEWFSNLQAQLDEDAATNLQNQIGMLSTLKTEIKTSVVNAINWIVDKIGGTDISGIADGTVTGAITELKDRGDELDSKLGWKLLGSTTGKNKILLPSAFEEILVKTIISERAVFYTKQFPRIALSSVSQVTFGGGYWEDDNAYGYWLYVSNSQIHLENFVAQGVDVTENTTTTVYYR